jgi:hypothetical protein
MSDGLADDPMQCIDFLQARIRHGQRVPIIHAVRVHDVPHWFSPAGGSAFTPACPSVQIHLMGASGCPVVLSSNLFRWPDMPTALHAVTQDAYIL